MIEGQESSHVTSRFQKLAREPSAQIPVSLHRLHSAPILPFPGNKEARSTGSTLLYCYHFSFAFFHNQAPGQKGRLLSHQSPHTDGAAPSCPAGSESTTAAVSLVGGPEA